MGRLFVLFPLRLSLSPSLSVSLSRRLLDGLLLIHLFSSIRTIARVRSFSLLFSLFFFFDSSYHLIFLFTLLILHLPSPSIFSLAGIQSPSKGAAETSGPLKSLPRQGPVRLFSRTHRTNPFSSQHSLSCHRLSSLPLPPLQPSSFLTSSSSICTLLAVASLVPVAQLILASLRPTSPTVERSPEERRGS
ncbi:hypothetical protein BDV59DRAFT_36877 [Aspergillus ambiguus]|uniref:uncharacterized protein n=1 Tax=Aspergillus ambiguus TaxID=176160 RepID=UPI003CCD5C40